MLTDDVAKIAQTQITRITALLEDNNTPQSHAFNDFLDEIRDDLNAAITKDEVIEMVAQHLITKPVFDALFLDTDFAKNNVVSQGLDRVVDTLDGFGLERETEKLKRFYASVHDKAKDIKGAYGKQRIIVDLYDTFFQKAFPKMAKKLGIVYTPVEVVDFILHSVNDVMKNEFNKTLGSDDVHILDPFTGTGTFMTRLIGSGLLTKEELTAKFQTHMHANEIVLLAYYIASINIEVAYGEAVQADAHTAFKGMCLTDTFDSIRNTLPENSDRRKRQKTIDSIQVIIGNPPYSVGQKSANDNAANVAYPALDDRIRETYAAHSTATNKNSLFDSYIRAIRWASDRLGTQGVIGFVTNGGYIDANAMDGLRKSLHDEFSDIYIINLRGNQRLSGDTRLKEGGGIFTARGGKGGSKAPISITLLVKNPNKVKNEISYYQVSNYCTTIHKKQKLVSLRSINGITAADQWTSIRPNEFYDWINQRDPNFDTYLEIGNKKDKTATTLFENYSLGIQTNRDAWCYNSSHQKVEQNMSRMIDFYNAEVDRYQTSDKSVPVKDFVNSDATKISWSSSTLPKVQKGIQSFYKSDHMCQSIYRPFEKSWLYYDKMFNHGVAQMPRIFPHAGNGETHPNRVIAVSGIGARSGFTALMTNALPNLHTIDTGQCFPLYLYDEATSSDSGLFDKDKETALTRRDAITDDGLHIFNTAYPDETITKEDIFYYVYGLLHSPDYRARYDDNLSKQLPRIPCVNKAADFLAFSKAGRTLADLHTGFETAPLYPVNFSGKHAAIDDDFYVKKMKFVTRKEGGKSIKDKTKVIYNGKITMTGIPLRAYDYVVNGKPALEWVMERQAVKTHKDSGIVNDANDYARETLNNPRYPLELFQRVITVSLDTMDIIATLPPLDI